MKHKIPIIMCIDVEPDPREVNRYEPEPWKGYEETAEYFSALRPRLEKATGSPARFSWFLRMDHQVEVCYGDAAWPVTQYPRLTAGFEQKGDCLALHTHAWRWSENAKVWIVDHGNQPWIEHCLDLSFDAYRGALGRDCDTFRFGDRYMNDAIAASLEARGVRYDLTLEPGLAPEELMELHTAPVPDYLGIPRTPYHPDKNDFRQPDPSRTGGLWMIPMSTGEVEGKLERGWRALRNAVWPYGLSRPETITLNLYYRSRTVRVLMDHLIKTLRRPYIAFVIRTNICQTPVYLENMTRTFEAVMSHPLAKQFVFATPGEAMDILGYGAGEEEEVALCRS